ncbi:MAG: lamin tail domain-containing protein [Candidatus Cloacimonetes bacterium]|nr:lamin tail domain-containing protein [Candidatus Cloacimonadota bacterium]
MLAAILCAARFAVAQVVINEIYYDHPGNDEGYEWLELYNAGAEAINLYGWTIEKAGSEFTAIFIFPEVQIFSGGFFLVGEAEVNGADLIAELVFQNGGDATDGVRLVSADSLWTDTVLYDFPNSNGLPDDSGEIGMSFAPDATAGSSLGRFPDGADNNLGTDWQECQIPSPKAANIISIDLEICQAEMYTESGKIYLYTAIHNLSTNAVDNFVGSLDIYLNNQPFESLLIDSITSEGYREYYCEIGDNIAGYYQAELHLNSIYDSNIDNNISGCSLLIGISCIQYNELMVKPLAMGVEWIEFLVNNPVDNFVGNLSIKDTAGNSGSLSAADLQLGYVVVCDEPQALIGQYGLSPEQVIECGQLPGLNDTGDILYLLDKWDTLLARVEYSEQAGQENGISWERVNPWDSESEWGICQAETGQTAGSANSIMAEMIDLALEFRGIIGSEAYLYHYLCVQNQGITLPEEAVLEINWTELSGSHSGSSIENLYLEGDSLEIEICTELPETGYYRYTYELLAEGDSDLSNNQVETCYNLNSLGWVINEIMYHPESGAAEWLELKRNSGYGSAESLQVLAGDESCVIVAEGDYVLITGSAADVEEMQASHGEELEIYEGLKRLPDSGCQLGILDMNGNLFEIFTFDPAWNQSKQGISIERVNPLLPANADNWSRSVAGSTPGAANSIYTDLPVTGTKLTVTPGIFNPAQGEHTVIAYQNTANLNMVKIAVYDLKGRKLREIADQEYQGSEGYYLWDGRDKSGKIVTRGIYIILFESSAAGRIHVEKATVVVKR